MMAAWSCSFSKLMHVTLAAPIDMVMVWVTEVTKAMAIIKQGVNAIVRNCEHNVPAFNLSLFTLPSTND